MPTMTKVETNTTAAAVPQQKSSNAMPAVGVDVIVTLEDGSEVLGFLGVDNQWWHATEYYTLEYKSWRPT